MNGKRVFIMRELPKQILTERKQFKKLTYKMKAKDIKFRWELPKGLFQFWRKGAILTEDQMHKFLNDNTDVFANWIDDFYEVGFMLLL